MCNPIQLYYFASSNNNNMIYSTSQAQRKQDSERVTKIGKLNKANNCIRIQEKRDIMEDVFMRIAFKSNRAESQRESRRAKR